MGVYNMYKYIKRRDKYILVFISKALSRTLYVSGVHYAHQGKHYCIGSLWYNMSAGLWSVASGKAVFVASHTPRPTHNYNRTQ
jgi:hypothetical protein